MIRIPIAENRVGLAATTDTKLHAADFSGSGLEALGHGLEELGQAGGKFAGALDDRQARDAAAARKAQAERTQSLQDDAQAKQAYVALGEQTREMLSGDGGYLQLKGIAAIKGAQPAIKQLESLPAKVVDHISDAAFAAHTSAMLSRRTVFDIARVRAHALAETVRWQREQAEGILDTARADALATLGTPLSAEHVATGLSAIETQALIDHWSPEARKIKETGFVSLVHADAIDQQMVGDPVGARAYYELHKEEMNEADRAVAERSLHLPELERHGAALVDGYAGTLGATAPQAAEAPGSAVSVADRMTAITMRREAGSSAATASAPVSGEQSAGEGTGSTAVPTPAPDATLALPTPPADRAAVGGSLAGMMDRYGGDPAKAWAAYKLGPERVDAALATHGDAWFGEMPADGRDYVANNVAMLGGGSGYVPKREELGAIRAYVEGQDLPPEVKQAALVDAEARVVRGERVIKLKQDDATNAAYAAADELGGDFTSITQIHPAIQRDLPPETLAALTRQARQNALGLTVAENGEAIADLNQLAATDPAALLTKDLRLVRDTMTPGEYAGVAKLQEALRADPASPLAVAHRRIWDKIAREGTAAGLAPEDPATRQRVQAMFARISNDVVGDTGGTRLATDKEVDAAFERAIPVPALIDLDKRANRVLDALTARDAAPSAADSGTSRGMANDSIEPGATGIPTYADGHLLNLADFQKVGRGGGVRPPNKTDVNRPIFIGGGGEGYTVFGQDFSNSVESYLTNRPGGANFFTHWDDGSVKRAIKSTHDAGRPVILVGHSWGGADAISAARWARDHKIPIDLLITVDPVGQPDYLIWSVATYKGIARKWITVVADKPGVQSGDVVARAWGKTSQSIQGNATVVLHDTGAGHADFQRMIEMADVENLIKEIYRSNRK